LRTGIVLNISTVICLAAALTPAAAADSAAVPEAGGERVRIGVSADRRSGRLVRRVTVEPVDVTAKAVTAGGRRTTAEGGPRLAPSERINTLVANAAREHAVDPLLVHALISVESAYNPYAISPAGAQGLMQLMPATARQLGVRNSFDAEENIRAGVKHLKELQQMYKDDRLALAAYNAGAGAVNRYGWIPPYKETQEYVYKVGKRYGEARRAASVPPAAKQAEVEKAVAEEGKTAESERPRDVEIFYDSDGRLHMRTR
jgi:hypothetical protein